MDVENQEAPQAETIDRRALLEEQLEAAERGEPIEAKTRDESGGRHCQAGSIVTGKQIGRAHV